MSVPWTLRAPVRRARNAAAAARLVARQRARWRAIVATPPRRGAIAVSYGVESMPSPSDVIHGGAVKFELLHHELPNAPRDFNILYLGSSSMPVDAAKIVRLARRRAAAFVWNQNGVAYRGWYGEGWGLVNRPRARLLHEADHVVYQSAFCKVAADRFYGERAGPWEVLHNPVDTSLFVPADGRPSRPLTLLLAGSQYQRYRVELALETLALLRRDGRDTCLVVAGAISFAPDGAEQVAAMIRGLRLGDAVKLVGPYTRRDAPSLCHCADLLLHPKYNDPCPTVVLEAMACGLPVAYSGSGGTPELVGDDAGVGIETPLDWEQDRPPSAAGLASAVACIADDLNTRAEAARARALRFDARRWIERHREIFERLLA